MPEGAIRLKGTGAEIIALCDGARNIEDILTSLQQKYPKMDPAQLEAETLDFLKTLRDKRVLDY